MVEAVRTTASPAGIWVIVVVAMGLLAFWLTAIMLADRSQARTSGRSDPALYHGGVRAGADGRLARGEPVPQEDTPTRVDLPAQRAGRDPVPAQPAGKHTMPAQRSGDDDRAERSYAGPGRPGNEETGQS